ncbi:hypothetical protein EGH25_06235 [Haladaptatus sp. F3-133]|jgi:sulfite exporter TauE/SafE|uniref:Uncharacterized protein n=1 Tax=Halorutilus salinus TaxID=2487751 RepID=A0A9Q4GGQ6_9EURY|nr:hypothetical protein [Halorutilus salinus]MCX2818947.1 hypothetical protein [Halorutilus salinus]
MLNERAVRRTLMIVGAVLLLVSLVLTEPQRLADMAVASVGAVMLLTGLYLSRRAERRTAEKAEKEKRLLAVEPDRVPEEAELPKREPFDGEG